MQKSLELELKELIVTALTLDDIAPEEIGDEEPLLFIGAGLDSIDVLELIMVLRREYGVEFGDDGDEIQKHFHSVQTLSNFVSANRTK